MLTKLVLGLVLMATCVVIHASGVTGALRWLRRTPLAGQPFGPAACRVIRLATWMIVCHLLEICVWALLYWSDAAIPYLESAVYFSAVTYTTTGYGDLVLSREWRLVGGIEALTGILMCGASTAFFFAVL